MKRRLITQLLLLALAGAGALLLALYLRREPAPGAGEGPGRAAPAQAPPALSAASQPALEEACFGGDADACERAAQGCAQTTSDSAEVRAWCASCFRSMAERITSDRRGAQAFHLPKEPYESDMKKELQKTKAATSGCHQVATIF